MNVSPSFLAGLATTLIAGELFEWLPGEASAGLLAASSIVLPLPGLMAAAAWRRVRAAVAGGGRAPRWAALAARLAPVTIPFAMLVLTVVGGLVPIVERAAPSSHALRFALLLAPLLVMELSVRAVERRAAAWLDARQLDLQVPLGPPIAGMTALISVAVLVCGLVFDLTSIDRRVEVLFRGTTVGTTAGMILLVVGASALLPLLFRFVLPTRRSLPPVIGEEVREIAARLGFPERRVLALHTDMRVVNAALVGPLRWPRYLVLTDGILAFLDRVALRGVVAHEVGHARAGHPGLVVIVLGIVPLLLVQPLFELELDTLEPGWLLAIGAAGALTIWFLLRALMHRFEFEADQISAEALGGASPCITALRRVGDLFPTQRGRSSFRHPSEERRVRALTLWDRDPAYRAAFRRRGRALRIAILAMLGIALAVSTWSHARTAALDAAVVHLYTGDFARARAALAEADPTRDPDRAERVLEELDAADSLVPGGGDWEAIATQLADAAWRRALELVVSGGARAARPYFGLALSGEQPDPLRESAWLWSEAVVAGDRARAARLAEHLSGLRGLPEGLRSALRT